MGQRSKPPDLGSGHFVGSNPTVSTMKTTTYRLPWKTEVIPVLNQYCEAKFGCKGYLHWFWDMDDNLQLEWRKSDDPAL